MSQLTPTIEAFHLASRSWLQPSLLQRYDVLKGFSSNFFTGVNFKWNYLRKSRKQKNRLFISTSHVDFLKAHIKLSNLANLQNFLTLHHWIKWMGLFLTFFRYWHFYLKLVPFSQIWPNLNIQTLISEHFSCSTWIK